MSNFFQNIFGGGKSSFTSRTDTAVGIDIGASSIKAVELRKKGGRAILETYGELSLGPYMDAPVGSIANLSTEVLTKAIQDVFKETGIKSQNVALSLPASSSLIFILELPGVITEDKIKDVVPLEARRYIPVPITEVSLDWWMIPRRDIVMEDEEEGKTSFEKTEVLVVAVRNDMMEKYRQVFEATGMAGGFFEIEIFASMRASLGHNATTELILDFGASKTKIAVIENGIIKRFHIISKGSFEITSNIARALDIPLAKAEQTKKEFGLTGLQTGLNRNVSEIAKLVTDYIISETSDVISTYERKSNRVISRVILTGGGSLLKGFMLSATETFRTEVVFSNPFSKAEASAFIGSVLESVAPPFSVAMGLALKKLQ